MTLTCIWTGSWENRTPCGKPAAYEGVQDKPCPDGPPYYCLEHGDIVRRDMERTGSAYGACYCVDEYFGGDDESSVSWVIGLCSVSTVVS